MPKHPIPMPADLVKDQRLGNICTGAFGRRLLSAYAFVKINILDT